jgi:hypothetical protein
LCPCEVDPTWLTLNTISAIDLALLDDAREARDIETDHIPHAVVRVVVKAIEETIVGLAPQFAAPTPLPDNLRALTNRRNKLWPTFAKTPSKTVASTWVTYHTMSNGII